MQVGIYRQAEQALTKDETSIMVIPNPAKDYVNIYLMNISEGICRIEVINTLGQTILKDIMNCKEKSHIVRTKSLVNGIYTVKVIQGNVYTKVSKLIIQR